MWVEYDTGGSIIAAPRGTRKNATRLDAFEFIRVRTFVRTDTKLFTHTSSLYPGTELFVHTVLLCAQGTKLVPKAEKEIAKILKFRPNVRVFLAF